VIAGLLAEVYHFQPSEIDAMTADDLRWWVLRLEETAKRKRG